MEKQTSEIWKEVAGFDGIYKVSNFGQILVSECVRFTSKGRSRRFGAKLLRSTPTSPKGYPWVILCHPKTRERRHVPIHILVAETFFGPKPSPKHEVNHKDGNKRNTNVENLEWLSHSDNCTHAYDTGLRNGNCRFITYNGQTKRANLWAKEYGINPSTFYTHLDKGYSLDEIFENAKSGQIWEKRNEKIAESRRQDAPKYKDGLSAIQWAAKLKISRAAFLWRIKHYCEDEFIYKQGRHLTSGPK